MVLILRQFSALVKPHRKQSPPLYIRRSCDASASCPDTFTLFKRQIQAYHPPCARGRSFILSAHNAERTSYNLSPTAHGTAVPTTTLFTAWPRCAGEALLGRFSALRPSMRTTCAATPTRTTRRCGARLGPLDSASAARSRSPTARSASPTTGSKNH